jgi:hypothetical protein
MNLKVEEKPNEVVRRSQWLLAYFQKSCEHLKRNQQYKVWFASSLFQARVARNGYHAEIVETNWFIKQKVNYIYNNPVKDKIVTLPEDYYLSSARNYAGLENDLEVILLDLLCQFGKSLECFKILNLCWHGKHFRTIVNWKHQVSE